jgi:hypothetical protein
MRVLRTIVEIPMLAMLYARKHLPLGGFIALQFIGDDDSRHIQQVLEQLTEELLCGPLIPSALHQDIEHPALLIDRPPKIMVLSLDRQTHPIHMPLVSGSGTATTQLIGIVLAKLPTPLANGFIRNDDSAFQQ